MSDTPVKVIVDLSKPAGQRQSIVPLTAEEISQREADILQAVQEQAEREAAEEAKAEAKASALAKLEALGLSEAEAQAILGA